MIIGNSGSGKDAIIQDVIKNWSPGKIFLRAAVRYITRPVHESEPFISIRPKDFFFLKNEKKFFLTWHSYGFDYGIGNEILTWISEGTHVLANVSRLIVPNVKQKFSRVKVVFISVPLELTIYRLKKRKREPVHGVLFNQRLLRAKHNQEYTDADFTIENNGPLDQSAQKLSNYILTVICQGK